MKPTIERRAMSFAGLAKPIQHVMFVCGLRSAATVDYRQGKQGATISKKRNATNALLIKSFLDSAKSVKKLFVLIIRPRQKPWNADLRASHLKCCVSR